MGHDNLALKIGAVFVPGAVACTIYWLLALWLKIPAAREIAALLSGRFRK
jgi:hypothetical protein